MNFPIYGKIKSDPNHQPVYVYIYHISIQMFVCIYIYTDIHISLTPQSLIFRYCSIIWHRTETIRKCTCTFHNTIHQPPNKVIKQSPTRYWQYSPKNIAGNQQQRTWQRLQWSLLAIHFQKIAVSSSPTSISKKHHEQDHWWYGYLPSIIEYAVDTVAVDNRPRF